MAVDYTTTGLVKSLKRRGSIPTSQALFLTEDFVSIMDEEMQSVLIPEILSVHEEYFVTYSDTALVANQASYRMPSRALGGSLRDIVIVDSDGNETPLTRLSPETVKETSNSFGSLGIPGIYLQDDTVIIVPTPTESLNSLRFKFERRPNQLCQSSAAAQIVSINSGAKQVTTAGIPSTWTIATTLDIIRQNPMFTSVGDDLTINTINSATLTFDNTLPSGIAVGQWICSAGTSPVPQLPLEAHYVIAQLGAAKCLEIMSDKGMKAAAERAGDMISRYLKVINPRIEGSPKKISNRNGIFNAARGRAIFPR